ncbi:MAG TPA: permease-like cell division protein FtsX [Acidimicrobiales bacterium]|nr:permease-like cell division protein FtsX [Acidimicrobiales bacterium]
MKFDYILRETAINLRRNITLTLAAIVTVGVSLALFGSTLLLRQGVENQSARWQDGVQVLVFLQRNVTDEQRSALEKSIEDNPEVDSFKYVDVKESNQEARRLFRGNAAMLQRLEADPEMVPPSYRLVPRTTETGTVESLRRQYEGQPGVQAATGETEGVKTVRGVSHFGQLGMLVAAVILLVAALMLILNAIRMATFARRREIEVMKLVGATNWFIRVPFMLEGIIQGLVGGLLAFAAVWGLDRWMQSAAQNPNYDDILGGFVASTGEFIWTSGVVVALGIGIGAAGSGWALSRFLKV